MKACPPGSTHRCKPAREGLRFVDGAVPYNCGRGGYPAPDQVPANRLTRCTALPHPLSTDLEQLACQVAEAAALKVIGVHIHSHRIPMTVQVLVRRADDSDVSLDDCAHFSGPLGEALEASALLDAPYVLEVSSPGIGEELSSDRDFTSFRSFPVAVHRRAADGSETIQEGLLVGRDAEVIQLNVRGRTVRLPRQEVVRVRLVSPRDGP